MDTDLDQMTREALIAEVKKLRHGIRQHRDRICIMTDTIPTGTAPL